MAMTPREYHFIAKSRIPIIVSSSSLNHRPYSNGEHTYIFKKRQQGSPTHNPLSKFYSGSTPKFLQDVQASMYFDRYAMPELHNAFWDAVYNWEKPNNTSVYDNMSTARRHISDALSEFVYGNIWRPDYWFVEKRRAPYESAANAATRARTRVLAVNDADLYFGKTRDPYDVVFQLDVDTDNGLGFRKIGTGK